MLLSFPPHIHFVRQFWSQLNFVVQSPNIHTKCLIQAYWFWKAQNCVLMQKKCSARLVRFLHFLFWLKTCFVRPQLAYKEISILLLHHTIFSHFWSFETTFFQKCEKIVWWSKKIELSLQASWSRKKHSFSQNKKCKNLTKRAEHFFDVKVRFLNNFGQYWTIFRNNIFSKMWENCVMKQQNGGFFVS